MLLGVILGKFEWSNVAFMFGWNSKRVANPTPHFAATVRICRGISGGIGYCQFTSGATNQASADGFLVVKLTSAGSGFVFIVAGLAEKVAVAVVAVDSGVLFL